MSKYMLIAALLISGCVAKKPLSIEHNVVWQQMDSSCYCTKIYQNSSKKRIKRYEIECDSSATEVWNYFLHKPKKQFEL